MDEPKQSPFALNKGRVLILALGALIVVIALSTWFGGINAYQSLREANADATTATPEQTTATEAPAQQPDYPQTRCHPGLEPGPILRCQSY